MIDDKESDKTFLDPPLCPDPSENRMGYISYTAKLLGNPLSSIVTFLLTIKQPTNKHMDGDENNLFAGGKNTVIRPQSIYSAANVQEKIWILQNNVQKC